VGTTLLGKIVGTPRLLPVRSILPPRPVFAATPLRRVHALTAEGFGKNLGMLLFGEHKNLKLLMLVSDGVLVP
jgi:hypothetical protein